MTIARIENGEIVEQRDIDLADVPEHKRGAWLPVEGDPPAVNRIQYLGGPALVVEAKRVLREWTVHTRRRVDQIAMIKAEAQRRILALTGSSDIITGLIKQSNAHMRSSIINDKRLRGEALTEAEEAEAATLRAVAAAVAAIRARSNEIEAIDPIPDDYDDDKRWPA